MESSRFVALLSLGEGEVILILALILILFGAKLLSGIGRGLGLGVREFRKAIWEAGGEIDEEASDAGRSLGGIYGKPAAEALTPDNQTAELYDPAVFGDKQRAGKTSGIGRDRWSYRLVRWISHLLAKLLKRRR